MLGEWCNGNTTVFGAVIMGSSPVLPTRTDIKKRMTMIESGNYPAGAELDPRAPWNEVPSDTYEDIKAECAVRVTLEREQEVEACVDAPARFEDIDWHRQYEDNNITLTDMFEELRCYVEKELEHTPHTLPRYGYLCRMLAYCQGWKVAECDVDAL